MGSGKRCCREREPSGRNARQGTCARTGGLWPGILGGGGAERAGRGPWVPEQLKSPPPPPEQDQSAFTELWGSTSQDWHRQAGPGGKGQLLGSGEGLPSLLRMLLSPQAQSQAGAWRGHIGQRGRWDGEDRVGVQNQHPSPPTRLAVFLRLLRVARFQQVLDPLPPQGPRGGFLCCHLGLGQGATQACLADGPWGRGWIPSSRAEEGRGCPLPAASVPAGAASAAPAFLRASPGPSGERAWCPSALPTPSFTVMGPMARRPQTLQAGPLLNWQLHPPIAPSWLGNDGKALSQLGGGGRKPPQASCVAPGQEGGCWQRAKRGGGFRRRFASKILLVLSAPS